MALVAAGDVREGMRLLDEATTSAVAGEIAVVRMVEVICCHLIDACQRVRDLDRAGEWCLRVEEISERYADAEMFATCRTHYADLLVWRGQWSEAEQTLTAACRDLGGVPRKVADGLVRLAELRRRQGRPDQAEALLAEAEGHRLALLVHGALLLDRGDAAGAAEEAERYLRRVGEHDRFERAPGLELLVQACLRRGDRATAEDAAAEIERTAGDAGTAPLRAAALLARDASRPTAAPAAAQTRLRGLDRPLRGLRCALRGRAWRVSSSPLPWIRSAAPTRRALPPATARSALPRSALPHLRLREERVAPDRARARGAAPARAGPVERRDRLRARRQRAHRRAARREHLRQDRRLRPQRARRGHRVGARPRPRLTRYVQPAGELGTGTHVRAHPRVKTAIDLQHREAMAVIDAGEERARVQRLEAANDVLRLSAVEQAALVRPGEISARELVGASLARIERLNPDLNAFSHVCGERALAEADGVRAGDARPLCGVPIGIKDLLSATEGFPTSEGSGGFGDWVADHDSAHVRRLRDAGAIVVGKTNTPELGLRPVTENARFGATRNPWNRGLSAGGSSGGSAAAVASGMVALADGSDLGGSIRIPASCCGVVGLKAGLGRVSIGPDFGDIAGGMPVDGALTRTVLDTAVALDAIAGYEPGDRHTAPGAPQSYAQAAGSPPPRLAVRLSLSAPLGVPVDDGGGRSPRPAPPRRSSELGHDVRAESPELGRRVVPVQLGDVHDGLCAAPRARRRAAARQARRPRGARAGDARLADRLPAPSHSSTTSRRASACGHSPAASSATGATTRFSSHPRSPACPPSRRRPLPGRRHRRRRPLQLRSCGSGT